MLESDTHSQLVLNAEHSHGPLSSAQSEEPLVQSGTCSPALHTITHVVLGSTNQSATH